MGHHQQKYWFVCSFYGIDENSGTLDFSVVPNPNNGQMTLNFERLVGSTDIKVYDMMGRLVDQFEVIGGLEGQTITYNLKGRSDGIYFFVATNKDGTMAKKVIVQQ